MVQRLLGLSLTDVAQPVPLIVLRSACTPYVFRYVLPTPPGPSLLGLIAWLIDVLLRDSLTYAQAFV
ncbi:hypothetical protein D9758_013801 [Tetrapyrgos nigripes]|uniref:Uncharacterized protein n=1 Tax=Tetrapyrgos nigripes TaxID=182062 RepID=A0A8H5D6F6_9AGAR|nr:hypothetical protein D9758_013801 [Tetrapyrgos nigripes]